MRAGASAPTVSPPGTMSTRIWTLISSTHICATRRGLGPAVPTAPSPAPRAVPPAATWLGSHCASRAARSPPSRSTRRVRRDPGRDRRRGGDGRRRRRCSTRRGSAPTRSKRRSGDWHRQSAMPPSSPPTRCIERWPRRPRLRVRCSPAGPKAGSLVAMSGGVDSAVAALLESERGREVVGVTLKLWADPETDGAKACCSPEAVLGARSARAFARHPASDPRSRGGVPSSRRGASSSPATPPARRRTPASPAMARCGSRRWSTCRPARRQPSRHRPLRPHRRRRRRDRCSPPPRTRRRTRATCWRHCRRRSSSGSASR